MSYQSSRCDLVGKEWVLSGDPFFLAKAEVVLALSRRTKEGTVVVPASPEQSRDLVWFRTRYPFSCSDDMKLRSGAAMFMRRQLTTEKILSSSYEPPVVSFARGQSPRDYQQVAADLFKANQGLLLADDVGLGKTVVGIAALTNRELRPACVIVPTHLVTQWRNQIRRFTPQLTTHTIKTVDPYSLDVIIDCPACGETIDVTETHLRHCPNCKRRISSEADGRPADVILLAYSKIVRWPNFVKQVCKTVIFDEVHALRSGSKTKRWQAAASISRAMYYRMGCSATPLYNLGGEAWNILECIVPGYLGEKSQFQQTWCGYASSTKEPELKDPEAFGSYLKSSGVMLRRTAKEVGRPVHDCEIIYQAVDADPDIFRNSTNRAGEIAELLLQESRTRGQDLMEFDALMRQSTGLAKAPAVASFVEMLLQQDESVVLFGWHQAVYDVYMEMLADWNPVKYTGTETTEQKAAAVHRFQTRDSRVIIISVRAGEGLDGLQFVSNTAVVGELDWTWSVSLQNVGRIARDGQTRPCKAYFLVSEYGSDPIVSQVLGLKKDQLNGFLGERTKVPTRAFDSSAAIKQLARNYLAKNRMAAVV